MSTARELAASLSEACADFASGDGRTGEHAAALQLLEREAASRLLERCDALASQLRSEFYIVQPGEGGGGPAARPASAVAEVVVSEELPFEAKKSLAVDVVNDKRADKTAKAAKKRERQKAAKRRAKEAAAAAAAAMAAAADETGGDAPAAADVAAPAPLDIECRCACCGAR